MELKHYMEQHQRIREELNRIIRAIEMHLFLKNYEIPGCGLTYIDNLYIR